MAGRGGVHGASSPSCVSRSLDRTLSDAQETCELKLSGRKLKDYPKAAAKFNLSDTVLAGKQAPRPSLLLDFGNSLTQTLTLTPSQSQGMRSNVSSGVQGF